LYAQFIGSNIMAQLPPKSIEEYAAISEQLIQLNKNIFKESCYVEGGLEFIELPGVFSLNVHKTPSMFTRNIPHPKRGKFLEIGPGVGVVAVTAIMVLLRQTCVSLRRLTQ
jgi:16S rRNA G1207 methylase RsmC